MTDQAAVYVANCELGRGVFAARPFAAGEFILRFTGPRISVETFCERDEPEANPLQIGATEYIDLEPPGVLANHSCEPNAGIKDDRVLIALRPIALDEEIRYDYSTTMWEDEEPWTMPCRCGSAACRGVVDQFFTLPPEIQARCLAQGIVMSFIKNIIIE